MATTLSPLLRALNMTGIEYAKGVTIGSYRRGTTIALGVKGRGNRAEVIRYLCHLLGGDVGVLDHGLRGGRQHSEYDME